MKNSSVLVTGAAGEIGSALIPCLFESGASKVVALDLNPDYQCRHQDAITVHGDVCDREQMSQLFLDHQFDVVFHFAALLSSAAEKKPFVAQRVNIDGTSGVLQCAYEHGKKRGKATRFLFPSSIAAYGASDKSLLRKPLTEDMCEHPETLYGIQKRFVEELGTYFTNRSSGEFLDFRSLRYPGLISIETLPTGGTSDYAAEMIHSAHQGKPYGCFVSAESGLPFMTMPDAVRALLELASAKPESLSRRVYNVRGFSVSAQELKDETLSHFPGAQITFEPVVWRDEVVASWPDDIDDTLANHDWGWKPRHDLRAAFREYFLPGLGLSSERAAACQSGV